MARYRLTDERLAGLKPEKGPVAGEDSTVGRTFSLTSSPADGLTPEKLISILREAKGGNIVEQSKLFEAMEDRDSVIAAHLQTRRAGVLSCGLEVVPDDAAGSEPLAQRAADLCEEVIAGIETRSHNPTQDEGLRVLLGWVDTLGELLDAIGKGFAAPEMIWQTSQKQWWVDHFERRPQRWFTLSGDELQLRGQGSEGIRLNPTNFCLHVHRAKAGMPGDSALLRHVTRPYVIKNYAIKDFVAFSEVFGMPMRVGYYTEGMTTEQKDELWRALYYLAVDSCALVPEGSRIEFPEARGASMPGLSTTHEKLLDACDQWITLAILGQILTSGGASGGSYALGQVHERVRYDLIDDDAARLEATVRQQIFTPLVRLNLGPEAPVPKAVIPRQPPKDLKEISEALGNIARLGVRIPLSWAHDQFGIPVPDEDEEIVQAPAAAPAGPLAANALVANAAEARGPKKKAEPPWAGGGGLSRRYIG